MGIFKRKITWGEALFGRKEHRIQMKRVKQMEKDFKKQKKENVYNGAAPEDIIRMKQEEEEEK